VGIGDHNCGPPIERSVVTDDFSWWDRRTPIVANYMIGICRPATMSTSRASVPIAYSPSRTRCLRRRLAMARENEATRVLEVTIAPGEREPVHTHRWPSVLVIHRPARIRYYTGDVLTFAAPAQPPPAAQPRVGRLEPEGPHSVENIDGHVYGAFRIELKQL
jgi:hypothetical protein